MVYNLNNNSYVLDLRLSRDLLPDNYFQRYSLNGEDVIERPSGTHMNLCQYRGRIRHVSDSWVAVSTCSGLR